MPVDGSRQSCPSRVHLLATARIGAARAVSRALTENEHNRTLGALSDFNTSIHVRRLPSAGPPRKEEESVPLVESAHIRGLGHGGRRRSDVHGAVTVRRGGTGHYPAHDQEHLGPQRTGLHLQPGHPARDGSAGLGRRQRYVPPLARRGQSADPRARRVDRGSGQRADQDDPDAQVLRARLLLHRPEDRLQGQHRRPGSACRAESLRPQPGHAVQLVRVHAQRRRTVDQQHPGRYVLRSLRGGREGGQRHGQEHRSAQAGRIQRRLQPAAFGLLGRVDPEPPRRHAGASAFARSRHRGGRNTGSTS